MISFHSKGLVLLGLMALSSYEAFAAFHFVVNECIVEVEFQYRNTLFVLFVQVKRLSGQKLEADIMGE